MRSEEMAKAKNHDEENKKENVDELKEDEKETGASNETNESVSEETNSEEDSSAAEIESLNNRLLRLQADFLNYKARTEKEKMSTYNSAVSDLLLDLLPVVDNLERALEADSSESHTYKEGVQMVYNQLMGILDKKGLKEVEALHKPFDHNVHYGVAFEESDEYEDGTVIDVLQKGYTVNERCIRPAMVRICRK
ncbi:MAG TPA: nucleotide exchange factor GrpE [Clostridiales bacterium]|nr:nucleotide exchange factor GrpE [Clostridiales bacterium]